MAAERRESGWVMDAACGLETGGPRPPGGGRGRSKELVSPEARRDQPDTARGWELLCLRICLSPRERILSRSLLIHLFIHFVNKYLHIILRILWG